MKLAFRCSDSDRVLECNGSITLAALVHKRPSSEGVEGTALHWHSARTLMQEQGALCELPPADPEWPSLKFSIWISRYYTRHIAETVPPDWSLECEVALAFEFPRFVLSGHIDCLAVNPDATECIGFDLKSGYNFVDEAEFNEQVFSYCGLLKRAYPKLTKIRFFVTQPRADEDDGFQRITECVLEGSRLEAVLSTLERRFNSALDNRDVLNTGRKQCRFCPAKLQCPAYRAERDLMKMTLTHEHVAAIRDQPEDTTLADWVQSAKMLASGFEEAETLAKERIAAQGSITTSDGAVITIKEQRGSYTVTDPIGMWNTLAEILPEERRAKCAKWSVSAIKDNIAEHMNIPATGKAAITSQTVFDAKCRQHVEQGTRKMFVFRT